MPDDLFPALVALVAGLGAVGTYFLGVTSSYRRYRKLLSGLVSEARVKATLKDSLGSRALTVRYHKSFGYSTRRQGKRRKPGALFRGQPPTDPTDAFATRQIARSFRGAMPRVF